jgi:hypothetical protein
MAAWAVYVFFIQGNAQSNGLVRKKRILPAVAAANYAFSAFRARIALRGRKRSVASLPC